MAASNLLASAQPAEALDPYSAADIYYGEGHIGTRRRTLSHVYSIPYQSLTITSENQV